MREGDSEAVSGDTPSPRLSQVPVRMSIVKLSGGGLFILNPIAATRELLDMVHELEKEHGPVKHVVLSTVAIEHKAYAAVWTPKFNLCFNSGSLEVCVRCCSLQSVECISRRSCPSLGLSEGRGAEIARRDNLTHWLISTQVRGRLRAEVSLVHGLAPAGAVRLSH